MCVKGVYVCVCMHVMHMNYSVMYVFFISSSALFIVFFTLYLVTEA